MLSNKTKYNGFNFKNRKIRTINKSKKIFKRTYKKKNTKNKKNSFNILSSRKIS
jgi:hypothetical protein